MTSAPVVPCSVLLPSLPTMGFAMEASGVDRSTWPARARQYGYVRAAVIQREDREFVHSGVSPPAPWAGRSNRRRKPNDRLRYMRTNTRAGGNNPAAAGE